MSYSTKKENIKRMARWILDTSTNSELMTFHTNEINNRYKADSDKFIIKDDLIRERVSERMVYWSIFWTKNIEYIKNNPSKDVLNTRLKLIKQKPDCTDLMYDTFIECLKALLENYYELGSSEAFIELVNKNPVKNDEALTFKWQKEDSQLKGLFNQLQAFGLIGKETTLNHFKKAFSGGLLSEVEQINFTGTNALVVYLFDMMNKQRLIRYSLKHNKVIEVITGITSVAQTRDKYLNSKTGFPKGSQDVDITMLEILSMVF